MRPYATIMLAWILLSAWVLPGQGLAQNAAQLPANRIGPSFPCPSPRDPLAQLICDSRGLSRIDLAFVQTYQAYRQQLTPEGQKALRAEGIEFGRTVRTNCGIGSPQATPSAPMPSAAPTDAAECVAQAYEHQRLLWTTRLNDKADQEARRPLDQHITLQRDLQALGLIPLNVLIDGVFGSVTRAAIMSFQQTMSLPVTGLLGNEDALVLEREASAHAMASPRILAPSLAAPPAHAAWEGFQGEALTFGIRASISVDASACNIALAISDPQALATAIQKSRHGSQADADDRQIFRTAMMFLRTEVAARAVRAVYAAYPVADACVFSATAFTADVYGRDVPQPLIRFGFDRTTYDKIVWDRFNPDNMIKIVSTFSYGSYAQERLRETDPVPPPLPPSVPANTNMPQAPPMLPATRLASAGQSDVAASQLNREQRFIQTVESASDQFATSTNDMAKGMSRVQRAKQICDVLQGMRVDGWFGSVETLSSSSAGKGVLVIRIAPHITLGTVNNDLSESLSPVPTLIGADSPVLPAAAGLSPKQTVRFSGTFVRAGADCAYEKSLTQAGSMTDPEFLFQFSSLQPADDLR